MKARMEIEPLCEFSLDIITFGDVATPYVRARQGMLCDQLQVNYSYNSVSKSETLRSGFHIVLGNSL